MIVFLSQIEKGRVDNFSSESTWVPECVLLLEWKQKEKGPEPLKYKVKLKGTGEERYFFRIVYDPGQWWMTNLCKLHNVCILGIEFFYCHFCHW